jgi:hypothetical protein
MLPSLCSLAMLSTWKTTTMLRMYGVLRPWIRAPAEAVPMVPVPKSPSSAVGLVPPVRFASQVEHRLEPFPPGPSRSLPPWGAGLPPVTDSVSVEICWTRIRKIRTVRGTKGLVARAFAACMVSNIIVLWEAIFKGQFVFLAKGCIES